MGSAAFGRLHLHRALVLGLVAMPKVSLQMWVNANLSTIVFWSSVFLFWSQACQMKALGPSHEQPRSMGGVRVSAHGHSGTNLSYKHKKYETKTKDHSHPSSSRHRISQTKPFMFLNCLSWWTHLLHRINISSPNLNSLTTIIQTQLIFLIEMQVNALECTWSSQSRRNKLVHFLNPCSKWNRRVAVTCLVITGAVQ